jgi:hypothetical protein
MNREERFIKFYNAVHAEVEGHLSRPEGSKSGKDAWPDGQGEDYSLAFSLDPSGEVHIRGYIPSRHAAVSSLGAADVVVCAGSPAYFAERTDPKSAGAENPNHLTYSWEEQLHQNLASLLQFVEDEPSSEVRWPENADYWRQRAKDGTADEKGRSWLRKIGAISGKVTFVVYAEERMMKEMMKARF